MITTTAKRSQLPPRLAPLAAALCGILITPATRADWSVRPALELRETYSDNVALGGSEPQAQWVTEINPALMVEHVGRRLTVKSAARLNYFIYGDERVSGTNRFFRQFDGSAKAEVVEDFLYVDASASLAPRNISPFGPQVGANRYSSANQADVATYLLSPSLVHRFGSSANMQLRYTRDRVDAGDSGFGSSDSNSYLFNLSSGTRYRTVGWNLYAMRQDVERFRADRPNTPLGAQRTISENAMASASYPLSRTFALTASTGYDKYDYSALGGKTQGASWSTGFAWTPSSRTSVQARVGKRFVGSSNSLDAQHRSRRSVWRLAYSEAVNTSRSNFMLPATFDTAALLDRMFVPTYPDPLARQQAVADYMRQTGLPAALVDNVSFLSNRFFLQKQLTATAGIKLARTNATLSLFRTRSDALTDSETDSVVLGREMSSLNTNTRQVGGNMTLNYKISPRSDVRFSQNLYHNTSLSGGNRKSLSRAARLSLTRTMARNLTATLELRRVSGSSMLSNYAPYRENAMSASLSYQR